MPDVRNEGLTIGNLGLALYNHGEWLGAGEALRQGIRLLESATPAHAKMETFRQALALVSERVALDAATLAVRILNSPGNPAEAQTALRQVLQLLESAHPGDPRIDELRQMLASVED